MKNKTPIIMLLILISIIVFCLVSFLIVYLIKGEENMLSVGNVSDNVVLEKTFELETIEEIEVIQDYGNITFEENPEDTIRVVIYGKNTENASASLNNKKLKIEDRTKNRFLFFNFGLAKSGITVYIPSTYANQIKIKVDCGDIKMNSLEKATLIAECDAGNIELENIKNANIKCNAGNIEAQEIFNKCEMELDAGNVKIEKLTLQEASKIDVDLGDVKIKETNDIYIDAKTGLGDTKINNNNRTSNVTLKIKVDCGNIKVEN